MVEIARDGTRYRLLVPPVIASLGAHVLLIVESGFTRIRVRLIQIPLVPHRRCHVTDMRYPVRTVGS
jgi:hypothetical protein